jgi:transcriptional regulator with XRE-family HTH domain
VTQNRSIGDRLREARKRRGLTQRELARLSGVSLSWIRKLEQDDFGDVRLETVHKLAVVLRVTTSALAAGSDAPVPAPADVTRWEPVARALEGSVDEANEGPTLGGVAIASRHAVRLFRDSRLADLGALLPLLLRDTDTLVSITTDGQQAAAKAERSRVRVLAGSLLVHTWQFLAAERAFALAHDDAGDPLAQIAVTGQRCFSLTRQGRLAECRELAVRRADEAEPRLSSATRDELAAWGGLLLWGAGAAVRDNRPGEADAMIRLAKAAAAAAGDDFVPPHASWHRFGPSVVAAAEAENAAIRGRPDTVLGIGRQLEPQARHYTRHRLDVAAAHAALRQYPEAVGVLGQMRQIAPEWLPYQRYAADILRKIIKHRRSLTPEMRELAGFLRLSL